MRIAVNNMYKFFEDMHKQRTFKITITMKNPIIDILENIPYFGGEFGYAITDTEIGENKESIQIEMKKIL